LVGQEYGNSVNGSEKEESQVTSDLGNGKDGKKDGERKKSKQQYTAYNILTGKRHTA
jgi:hypothetical protein